MCYNLYESGDTMTFKFEDVASLLDIDIEEVLYKYKSGINKLKIIINKSLSDENKS